MRQDGVFSDVDQDRLDFEDSHSSMNEDTHSDDTADEFYGKKIVKT